MPRDSSLFSEPHYTFSSLDLCRVRVRVRVRPHYTFSSLDLCRHHKLEMRRDDEEHEAPLPACRPLASCLPPACLCCFVADRDRGHNQESSIRNPNPNLNFLKTRYLTLTSTLILTTLTLTLALLLSNTKTSSNPNAWVTLV